MSDDEKAKQEAEAKAKEEAELKAKAAADAKAESDAKAKAEAEAKKKGKDVEGAEGKELAELKKQNAELNKQIKAKEDAEAESRKKKEEEELSEKELREKRDTELSELKADKLINEVRQDLGYTHKIFKFAPVSAADPEKGLTEKDVEAGMKALKSSLDEYFEKEVKPVSTPGAGTGNAAGTDKGKTETLKPAAVRFGFLPDKKVV